MKAPRIVVYLILGFLVAASLRLFLGSGGFLEYRRLLNYRESLAKNIEELEQMNEELLWEVEALGSDPERLTLQARELGYFREGERVIRVSEDSPGKRTYTVGRILRRRRNQPRADWPFRATGLALPLLLALVSVTIRRRRNRETGNR
jgi:cell division protein FtsB